MRPTPRFEVLEVLADHVAMSPLRLEKKRQGKRIS